MMDEVHHQPLHKKLSKTVEFIQEVVLYKVSKLNKLVMNKK